MKKKTWQKFDKKLLKVLLFKKLEQKNLTRLYKSYKITM